MKYPDALEKLIRVLGRLPGVGRRTAERYAFALLLRWKKSEVDELERALVDVKNDIGICADCGCIASRGACLICQDPKRARNTLCVVSSPRELFTIENTKEFAGLYHVLGGLLSPLDGIDEEDIGVKRIKARIYQEGIKEVILALDSTLEGDTTALYLKEEIVPLGVKVYRLAFGIPVGSSLEYVDAGSLARALAGKSVL